MNNDTRFEILELMFLVFAMLFLISGFSFALVQDKTGTTVMSVFFMLAFVASMVTNYIRKML